MAVIRFLQSLLPVLACLVVSGCDRGEPIVAESAAASHRDKQQPSSLGLTAGLLPPTHSSATNLATPSLPSASDAEIRFVDAADETGLNFVFDNGHSRARLMVESTSGGVGWLDYDGDGWWDLYLPQGGNPFAEDESRRSSNDDLFRNREGREFTRVTEQAGLRDEEFGHGAVTGDFDNDGFDDIYVSNVGADILYRNNGDGTFQDVTRPARIDNPAWAASAAWYDLDFDGDLDLYVCNYVDYDPRHPIACLSDEGEPGICHPDELKDVRNKCYLNLGDGTFRDIADERGLNGPGSKSLGVVVADLNGDSLPDVFVANDTTANHLFVNLGDAHFEERGHVMGCAMSGMGHYQASMGVAFGDYDENGFPDLYCTHFTKDSNTLYANFGAAGFQDVTREAGLHLPTLTYLAFGTVMADFDCNGRQDLFIANGHIDDWRDRGELWYMPAQLFTFNGNKWEDCGRQAGPYFEKSWLGRGVAAADYDADGDVDLLVVHQNDTVGLLKNESTKGRYLNFRFAGRGNNRRGIGVRVTVTQGTRRIVQQLPGGTSYCAGHQPFLFFGLGKSSEPCNVEIEWPGGARQRLPAVTPDQMLLVREADAEVP